MSKTFRKDNDEDEPLNQFDYSWNRWAIWIVETLKEAVKISKDNTSGINKNNQDITSLKNEVKNIQDHDIGGHIKDYIRFKTKVETRTAVIAAIISLVIAVATIIINLYIATRK